MATTRSTTEADTCDRFITPAIHAAGWDRLTQVRREYPFTAGRVSVRGKVAARGDRKRADYLLFYQPNLPLAVVEAKDTTHSPGAGMQQALAYADALDVPFAFSTNGKRFLFHDRTGMSTPVEQELELHEFPGPDELWSRYRAWKGLSDETAQLARFPYHDDGSGMEARYYQRVAIQRTVEAVIRGDKRILLVMATGTGKTYTAFQIIWRLWKSRRVRRVLFLVDRNILADQTMTDDFKPFGGAMTKVTNRKVEKSHEIYLALYQAITGTEDEANIYQQFSPDFFDLIVVDECHRGSAREDSAWRDVLAYFEGATHLGLTATPKETKDVSSSTYFGVPIYEYSLKQGIEDGFLAPYKVVRLDLDRDLQGWRPRAGMLDDLGAEIEDRVYNQRDMDRVLVLNQRTKLVAHKIVAYLLSVDPYGKTIVFCEDIDHAERMRRALVNEVAARVPGEKTNADKFVVRITGDSYEGKARLDDFMHPEKRYPVIATTSKLLTTGVNAKTCKVVALDQRIESIIEFKQIVGRGTRIHEDGNKLWFTILDFKKATELFADPDFDGEPEVIYAPSGGDPVDPDGGGPTGGGDFEDDEDGGDGGGAKKYVVSDVEVSVLAERVQYLDAEGRLITESLKDYTRATVTKEYASLDAFLKRWTEADQKAAVVAELEKRGVLIDALREQVSADLDPFDLICHVVFDQPPLTRRQRAENVRKRDVFTKYGDQARGVLDALLDKYADEGVEVLEDRKVLRLDPFSDMGAPTEIAQWFGGPKGYAKALRALEQELYRPADRAG
ncbi:MAG: DEAD/DEAH box helicase family protein [Myxococcales bacterium]|nr:DEAD/DEAH box helicase family protein [Myxococcales bacterium]